MNSLPLSNSYEVLRIDENDFAENENHDTTHGLNTLLLFYGKTWVTFCLSTGKRFS